MLTESKETLAAYFASEQWLKYCDLWFLRGRRVMWLLSDVARERARPDGWVELSMAGRMIQQEAPEELAILKAAYDQSTLKGLLLATELFEVYEEPTAKGGIRVLYREKSTQVWQVNDTQGQALRLLSLQQ